MLEAPKKSINVKELRQKQKLSRRKVSVALDVTEMTVHRWETGVSQPHLPLGKIQTMMSLFECDFATLCKAFEQTALETQQSTNEVAISEKIPATV